MGRAEEPEELAVEAYMDQFSKSAEAPTDAERVERLLVRYQYIKDEAKRLQCEREEIEATTVKNKEQILTTIRNAFTENFKYRKAIVTELRRLGQIVDDKFIPLSAT